MIDIEDMTPQAMHALLRRVGYGHLGCTRDGRPYVVPIHYAYRDPDILIFTPEGMMKAMAQETAADVGPGKQDGGPEQLDSSLFREIEACAGKWAIEAGERLSARAREALHVEYKGGSRSNPVSEADREAEEFLFHAVTHHFPDGASTTCWIDLYRRGRFVLEAKQGAAPPQPSLFGESETQRRANVRASCSITNLSALTRARKSVRENGFPVRSKASISLPR